MLYGLIAQSQEAEIKREWDPWDCLRKAGRTRKQAHSEDCVRGPLPIHTYYRHNTCIARYSSTVRGTQLSETHGQPGAPEGETAVS